MREKLFCYNCLKNQDYEIRTKTYPIVKDTFVISVAAANTAYCTVCGEASGVPSDTTPAIKFNGNNDGDWNTGFGNKGDANTGNRNNGKYNSGDSNTGAFNTGNQNTGIRNTGRQNDGNWNSGYENKGSFNTGGHNAGNSNTGSWNNGTWNSGDNNDGSWNSGDNNEGSGNAGDYNIGDRNTGNWNRTSDSTGFFCTETQTVKMFDIDTGKTRHQLEMLLPSVIWDIPFGSYWDEGLKTYTVDDRQEFYENLSKEDKLSIMSIPNFNPLKFKVCTGINMFNDLRKGGYFNGGIFNGEEN